MGSIKSKLIIFFLINLLISVDSFASIKPYSWRDEDKKEGYVDEIKHDDENEVAVPLYIIDNPNKNTPSLRDTIFNETLTKEFSRKYEEKFGRTEAEVFYTHNSISDVYLYQGHEYTQQQYFDEQKLFSTYMIRRVAEYHFDKEAKSNPVTKSIYTIKEKVKNMDFAISPNFKFVAQYTISGNDLRVEVINPWIISKVNFQMDPAQFTPTAIEKTTVNIGKKIDSNYQIESYYTLELQMIQLIARRRLTDEANISLTASPNFYRELEKVREGIVLAGFSWIF